MNTARFAFVVSTLSSVVALAQVAPVSLDQPASAPSDQQQPIPTDDQLTIVSDTGYSITEKGPHERTWQRVRELVDKNGFSQTVTNSYVEMASGMHVWSKEKQDWLEAR